MRIGGLLALFVALVIAVSATIYLRASQNGDASEVKGETTVVVAAEDIKSGQKLDRNNLKVIKWYSDSIPEGAFRQIEEIPFTESGPFAMLPIRKDNLIVTSQISGPNQRPTLSGLLSPGMVATTTQVNTISGVAGFVLPEERVDVILNRVINNKRSAEVIIENLRVLAVDTIVDPQSGKPVPAKSVTFEINREDAQRLTLAATLGEITLALRSASTEGYQPTARVSESDLISRKPAGDVVDDPTVTELKRQIEELKKSSDVDSTSTTVPSDSPPTAVDVTIVRGLNKDTQSLPSK